MILLQFLLLLQYISKNWIIIFTFIFTEAIFYMKNSNNIPCPFPKQAVCFKINFIVILMTLYLGSALRIIVIIVGNGLGDKSSNPGQKCLHFIFH